MLKFEGEGGRTAPVASLRNMLSRYAGLDVGNAAFGHGVNHYFRSLGDVSYLCLSDIPTSAQSLYVRSRTYTLLLCGGGKVGFERSGLALSLGARQAVLMVPGDRAELAFKESEACYFVSFGTETLNRGLAELDTLATISALSLDKGAVDFGGRSDIGCYIDALMLRADHGESDRISRYYNSIIGLLILESFVSYKSRFNGASTGEYVEVIKDYVSRNITGELTVEALADCMGVSDRQVYTIFNNLYGMTPGQYFKQVRVYAAHKEISSCSARENITNLAFKYGFTNPGRFSQHYKEFFGELPSQTMRKRLIGSALG